MITKACNYTSGIPNQYNANILIIDDDAEIQHALKDLLLVDNNDYNISTAGSSKEALHHINNQHTDIILIDIKLGSDNGLELLTSIKNISPDCICIMMTAHRDVQYTISAIRSGASDYLHKPINPQTLIDTIRHSYDKYLLTKQKNESDLRFKAIFEQTFQHIYLLDYLGNIIEINKAALEYLYPNRDDFINTHVSKLPYWKKSRKYQDLINSFISGNSSPMLQNDIQCMNHGDTVFFRISLKKIEHDYTNENIILLELNDITEQKLSEINTRNYSKELEQQVKERTLDLEQSVILLQNENKIREQAEIEMKFAKERAEKASMAKTEFLSRMSHELRTPMNAILGFAQLLQMPHSDPLTQSQFENVSEIMNGGNHLLELINDVLDLSKIDSGKIDVDLKPVNLSKLINQCQTLLKPLLTNDNIQFNNELDASNEILVIADQTQLKQVIINLLSNAIKYNNVNGSITIYAETFSSNKLRLYIKDTGIGIKTELQHRLFEPFDRLDNAFISTGTGIGLTVTKRLLDLMNADIGFTSTPGNGSVFWIEIDRA